MRKKAPDVADEDLLSILDASLSVAFGSLRRSVQKNLVILTIAFLNVLGAARSGNGKLSLGALYRVLPLSVYAFEYPWKEKTAKSQNQLEHVFLLDIESSLPKNVRAVFMRPWLCARDAA